MMQTLTNRLKKVPINWIKLAVMYAGVQKYKHTGHMLVSVVLAMNAYEHWRVCTKRCIWL